MEGLGIGADDYLTKPFHEEELLIRIRNLVEMRKKLHIRYASLEPFPPTNDPSMQKEDIFMTKVRQILEAHLEDDQFGITTLCEEMAVSHAQLYRKFKTLSNKTIADYLKSLRLEKARNLLITTRLNITEITFMAGFKNLSHFSREFGREFGKSPSEYRKS